MLVHRGGWLCFGLALLLVTSHADAQAADAHTPPTVPPTTQPPTTQPPATQPPATQPLPPATHPTSSERSIEGEALPPSTPIEAAGPTEGDCTNRIDDDGDSVTDCADRDCFHSDACEAGQSFENTDALCSDFIDNDGDRFVDCDDHDCQGGTVTRCTGSWRGPDNATGANNVSRSGQPAQDTSVPDLREGMTVEDMIGMFGDADGERSDESCSDGEDNDRDGRVDCADFGCRFDPQVTACREDGGLRFGVVVGAGGGATYEERATPLTPGASPWIYDARFTRVQLRLMGPIPFIQDSFFLVQMQAERQPRLQFLLFSVPLGGGHYVTLNSGSGNLSVARVVSASRQLLLDAPFFAITPFEQDNGVAVDLGGPITNDGRLRYRFFVAAGSGNFTGNVGGRFFNVLDRNFSYGVGGQLHVNLIGYYERFNNPFLYVPVPMTIAFLGGARFDQRPEERFMALNAFLIFRWSRIFATAEYYVKREFAFGAWQHAFIAQLGVLVVPRHLLVVADFAQFSADDYESRPASFSADLPRPLDQFQYRVGLHYYIWRNIVLASVVFREHHVQRNPDRPEDLTLEREIKAELQFRF